VISVTTAVLSLPVDLAPSLRQAAEQLVDECGLATHPSPSGPARIRTHRCTVCQRRGGKMGGHHRPDGSVAWIHKSCHRRLHRAGRR
jgi:hypothetical protein